MATTPSRHILVAEDNPMNQLLMTRLLKQLGHSCVVVNNGLEALRAVKKSRFDVVLMDIQMPEMDGIEATRRIRADPEILPAPVIIAVTANHLDKTRMACLDAGVDEFLTKPISITDLQEAIDLRPVHQSLSNHSNLCKRLDELVTLGDSGFVHELIDLFLGDTQKRLNDMEASVMSGDWESAKKIAHLMKGSASNMGAEELKKISVVIQEACDNQDISTATVALRQALQEYKLTEQQLTTWKQSHQK